jgi:hypothetical protein
MKLSKEIIEALSPSSGYWINENASPYEANPDVYGVRELVDSWEIQPPESIDENELEEMLEYYGLND